MLNPEFSQLLESFGKKNWERRKSAGEHFLLFSQCFFPQLKSKFFIWGPFPIICLPSQYALGFGKCKNIANRDIYKVTTCKY